MQLICITESLCCSPETITTLLIGYACSADRSCLTLWPCVPQAPLSTGFPRQEYWSGLPFLPPGDLPNPGIELTSSTSPAWQAGFFSTEPPGKPTAWESLHFTASQRPKEELGKKPLVRVLGVFISLVCHHWDTEVLASKSILVVNAAWDRLLGGGVMWGGFWRMNRNLPSWIIQSLRYTAKGLVHWFSKQLLPLPTAQPCAEWCWGLWEVSVPAPYLKISQSGEERTRHI